MGRRPTGTVATNLIQANQPKRAVYPPGRVCRHQDCKTVLSVYNAKAWCSLHADDEYLTRPYRHST